MNILFFTLSAGEGHNQVASTISEKLLSLDSSCNIEIIDTFNYINPKLHKIIIEGYIKSIKYLPELYGFFYKKTEELDNSLLELSEFLNKTFISKKILRLIDDFNPDVIICTHPIPSESLCLLKRKGKINVPLVITITDYTLHSSWLNKEIDYYIIPSENFKTDINYWELPSEKCYFYGIPIRDSFYEYVNRNEACYELGIDNTFTALIMGGGLGLGNITETLDDLIKFDIDIQLTVVTGKNKELYDELIKKYGSINKVKIFGYSSDIHKLMTTSDVIITKPGGLTITEAITKELPIILTCTLPGQEERNAEYILNNGIGMIATSPNALLSSINQLRYDQYRYNLIKSNMRKLKKPNACKDIANLLLGLEKEITLKA